MLLSSTLTCRQLGAPSVGVILVGVPTVVGLLNILDRLLIKFSLSRAH